jgi:hypothetical protein
MLDWEGRFLRKCKADPLTRKAWLRLERAGIGDACKALLWQYAYGQEHFAEIQRGTALIVHNLKAFERAQREEQRRLSDPRAQVFRERRETAKRLLECTPWPFRHSGIATFADANLVYDLNHFRGLRRIRALIGRSKLAHMLLLLQVGAMAYGVKLSGNVLASLADYASGNHLDGGAVRRMLRESWIPSAEAGYRAVFDKLLTAAN